MSSSLADSVELRAQTALTSSPIYALQQIMVSHEGDQLLLSGRVSTYYHKQLAQEAVRAVVEHVHVVNSITVD